MLKSVASKRRTRLLNKLNKSSAIHPGPGGSPVHVDQRRTAAARNITQWRRSPIGLGGGGVGTQRLTLSKARAERNYVRVQLQHLHRRYTSTPPPKHHLPPLPSWSIILTGEDGRGVGSTLRLDILSVDGTIIWEEIGESVEDTRPVSTY